MSPTPPSGRAMSSPLTPSDLTLPQPSSEAARAVVSETIRGLIRDLPRLGRIPPLRPVVQATAVALRHQPGAVFSALRRPTVGTAARLLRDRYDEALARQLAPTLAAELAAAGADLPPLSLNAPSRVCCIGARTVLPGGEIHLVDRVWTADGVRRLLGEASEGDGPYTEIADGVLFATVDDNPLALHEAHPEKAGNAIDLGGRTPAAWIEALQDAFGRIERYLPGLRAELPLVLSLVVPVGYDERQHLSASYAEALGTIYLSLHPDPMTMTEAVIHETSHNKLNALADGGPLLENAHHPLFSSPVRPDPRPLQGILLAVHAFLPIEALYRRMAADDDPVAQTPPFRRRFETVVAKNREGTAVLLEHALPTPRGEPVLKEIRALVERFDRES